MGDVLETRGRFRAVIHPDMDPQRPDGDFFGYVFCMWDRSIPGGHGRLTELLGKAYPTPDEDFSLDYLWERWRDMGMVERYLRIFCDVVGFDYFDTQDARVINIVTRKDLQIWGWQEDPASWPYPDPTHNNLTEWRAFYEGDVWTYTIEKNVTWTTDDEDIEDGERDGWEEVDSCGGFYGGKYAEESALEALDTYAPKEG